MNRKPTSNRSEWTDRTGLNDETATWEWNHDPTVLSTDQGQTWFDVRHPEQKHRSDS